MNKSLLLFSVTFLFIVQYTISQSRLDSLKDVLSKTSDDITRVDILNQISVESESPDSILAASISLSTKIAYDVGLINAQDILSNIFTTQGDYDSALSLKMINLDLLLQNDLSINLATTYSAIGLLHDYKGDYENAMTYFLEGLKVSEQIGDKKQISNFFNRIGIIYNYQSNYDKSIEFFQKSLELRQEVDDKQGQADIYNNLGIIYGKQNDIDKAIEYYSLSLKLKKELNDQSSIASSYNNLGTAYFFKGDYNKALDFYTKSLNIKKEESLLGDLASTYINIGEASLYLKDYNHALKYIETGLNLAIEMGNRDDIKLGYEELAQVYAEMKHYDSAYKYHSLYTGLKDSMFNKESDERIIEMQTKYDLEKKEKEIELLQKENEIKQIATENSNLIRNIFIIAFIIISFLIIAIVRSYKDDLANNKELSSNKKSIESQNEVLKTMNYEKDQLMKIVAHDLRSPLNQIDGLINLVNYSPENLDDDQKDALSSVVMATKHSRDLIRKILTTKSVNSSELKVNLEKVDIKSLIESTICDQETNLNRKQIVIQLESVSDNPTALVDTNYTEQIFENLISNAIKFSPHEKNIFVTITDHANLLRVEIKDEGPGFTEEDKKHLFGVYKKLSATPTGGETSTGLGLSIVKKYTETINGKVWCESEQGQGATFFVELPKS